MPAEKVRKLNKPEKIANKCNVFVKDPLELSTKINRKKEADLKRQALTLAFKPIAFFAIIIMYQI